MNFKNFRPASNLPFTSKLTERAVAIQTHSHMSVNSLDPPFQSAYRKHHSTETALLKVKSDILMNMNKQHVTLLVLLDLSALFTPLTTISCVNVSNPSLTWTGVLSLGLIPIYPAGPNRYQWTVLYPTNLILTVTFVKTLVLDLSFSASTQANCLKSLRDICLKFMVTLMTHNFTSPSDLARTQTWSLQSRLWHTA